jgi:hypothetical protein
VDDDVYEIDKDPAKGDGPLDMPGAMPRFAKLVGCIIGKGPNVRLGVARTKDEEVGGVTYAAQVDEGDIESLGVLQGIDNQTKARLFVDRGD